MRGVKLDLTGQRFGKLVVIGESEERKRGYAVWRVQCDCGVQTTFTTISLCRKTKPARSCDCLWKKPTGYSARHRVLLLYKRNANTHGRIWGLTDEQFATLTKTNCHYCDRQPRSVCAGKDMNGSYTYNGIDRKDNALGYVPSNVVSCCKTCNWAKGKMDYEEFMLWVADIVRHQAQKSTLSVLVRSTSA